MFPKLVKPAYGQEPAKDLKGPLFVCRAGMCGLTTCSRDCGQLGGMTSESILYCQWYEDVMPISICTSRLRWRSDRTMSLSCICNDHSAERLRPNPVHRDVTSLAKDEIDRSRNCMWCIQKLCHAATVGLPRPVTVQCRRHVFDPARQVCPP